MTDGEPTRTLHAWASEQFARENGAAIYRRPNGGYVAVTEVSENNQPFGRWPDLRYVGLVVDWRDGGFVQSTILSEFDLLAHSGPCG